MNRAIKKIRIKLSERDNQKLFLEKDDNKKRKNSKLSRSGLHSGTHFENHQQIMTTNFRRIARKKTVYNTSASSRFLVVVTGCSFFRGFSINLVCSRFLKGQESNLKTIILDREELILLRFVIF